MGAKSNAESDACINLVLTGHYVGLLTATPNASHDFATNPVTEQAGGGYARQLWVPKTISTAGDGHSRTTSNNGAITFGPATGSDWSSCTWFGIFAAISGGQPKYVAALTVAKTIQVGDTGVFADGALTLTED